MFFYCFSTAVPFLCFRCSFLLRRSPEELSGIRGRELTTEPSIGVDQEHTVSPSESETRERLFFLDVGFPGLLGPGGSCSSQMEML